MPSCNAFVGQFFAMRHPCTKNQYPLQPHLVLVHSCPSASGNAGNHDRTDVLILMPVNDLECHQRSRATAAFQVLSSTLSIETACPVIGSTLTRIPASFTFASATSCRAGIPRRKRSSTDSGLTPMMLS